jgi:hypothetical protein
MMEKVSSSFSKVMIVVRCPFCSQTLKIPKGLSNSSILVNQLTMMSFRAQSWLAVALVLSSSSSSAFVPSHLSHRTASSTHLNVAMDPRDILSENENRRNFLSEIEAALDNELAAVSDLSESEMNDPQPIVLLKDDASDKKMVATAGAGAAAIGMVAGSPLLFGAALGLAGSKLLDDSEEGLKNRKMLEELGKQINQKVQNAVEYTQTELLEDEEDVDLSKVSQKLMMLVQSKAGNFQEDAKKAPSTLTLALKEKFDSEEFQQDMKNAPGRAMAAFKGLMASEEVKSASGSIQNAFKAAMESDELKALKSRASQAVKESLENKKTE